jgi:hypothetical protein
MQDGGLLLLYRFVVVVFELRSLSLRCRLRRLNRLGDGLHLLLHPSDKRLLEV